ncbi:hypothetical protein ACT4WO_19780 (plasmid) [Acinetobacter baumannii]
MLQMIFILIVLAAALIGLNYQSGPASTESLVEINKLIEASKGQPYEADFKKQIAPLVKDGITKTEADDILHIYQEVRINTNLSSETKQKMLVMV